MTDGPLRCHVRSGRESRLTAHALAGGPTAPADRAASREGLLQPQFAFAGFGVRAEVVVVAVVGVWAADCRFAMSSRCPV